MYFKHFYDEDLAQGSYLIGCQATGEAVVVDPRRDVHHYVDEAAARGLRITAVTDTHIHADYVSGARELAATVGARLYLSGEGGTEWRYGFEHEELMDEGVIRVGNVTLQALHTPGHTPEHLSFLVTDTQRSQVPSHLLSGDFLFVGDVGRPDLLDAVAGGNDTRFEGARQLFSSLEKLRALPEHLQVWPGHGAGSACGKALGAVANSTLGYERLTSWWSAYVASGDEAGFVATLLEGQPEAPDYFGRMKRVNRDGPPLLADRRPMRRFSGAELRGRVNRDVMFLDTRPVVEQWAGSVPGALAVPNGRSFATYAAWVIDPEADRRPVVVLAADEAHAARLRDRLSYVGIDEVEGYVTSLEGLDLAPLPLVAPGALAALGGAELVDVRNTSEFVLGHVPGARKLAAANFLGRCHEFPRRGKLVVYCLSGERAALVASALRNRGFSNVVELEGSYQAWSAHAAASGEKNGTVTI